MIVATKGGDAVMASVQCLCHLCQLAVGITHAPSRDVEPRLVTSRPTVRNVDTVREQ